MLKDIRGYEGLYAVSDEGKVWSYRSKRFLSNGIDTQGYEYVLLCNSGHQKNARVHRLVLETFNPVEGMEKLQVNHIDEVKRNNNLSNLEWMTAQQNVAYSVYRRKRGKSRPVSQFTREGEFIATYPSQAEASRQTGVHKQCIYDVLKGKKHTAGGFQWSYEDGENKENTMRESQ